MYNDIDEYIANRKKLYILRWMIMYQINLWSKFTPFSQTYTSELYFDFLRFWLSYKADICGQMQTVDQYWRSPFASPLSRFFSVFPSRDGIGGIPAIFLRFTIVIAENESDHLMSCEFHDNGEIFSELGAK